MAHKGVTDTMHTPELNRRDVLSPFNGDMKKYWVTALNATPPFPATTTELCSRFGACPGRRAVLKGYLAMRGLMHQLEWVEGFQWVDAGFLEHEAKITGKAPDHIRVVTFAKDPAVWNDPVYADQFWSVRTRKATRATFSVDHVLVNLEWPIHQVIDHTRHWSALLSNQRQGFWDGLLKIELNTIEDDAEAFAYLESVKKP